MIMKVDHYSVTEQTMALVPNLDGEYIVKVFERDRTEPIYVKQTALKLIDQACKEQLSDIRSRRNAVRDQLNFAKKQPIAIDILRRIYAFPTESPYNPTCHWLFLSHIKEIKPLRTAEKNGKRKTKIIFKDLQELVIDTSTYILSKQYDRTLKCKEHFEELLLSGYVTYKLIAEAQVPYIIK